MTDLRQWLHDSLSINSYCWPAGKPFDSFINCVASAGIRNVAIDAARVRTEGITPIKKMLNAADLSVSSFNSAGYFTDPDLPSHNRQLVEWANELDAAALCVITGGLMGGAPPANLDLPFVPDGAINLDDIRQKGRALFDQLANDTKQAGVVLGLEPITPIDIVTKGHVNSIEQAKSWLHGAHTKLTIDLFHSFWDPALTQALTEPDDLVVFQFCDLVMGPDKRPARRAPVAPDRKGQFLPVISCLGKLFTQQHKMQKVCPIEFEIFQQDLGDIDIEAEIMALPSRLETLLADEI